MGARRILGPVRHPITNALLVGASISVQSAQPFASNTASYGGETIYIITDSDGQIDITLAAPDSGTQAYIWRLPNCPPITLNISAGPDTTLHALIAAASSAVEPSALQAHADVIASDTVLGHVRVGDGLSIDEDGVLSADGGPGGAVDSVNGQTGVVVLDASDVGADPSGTAAGLIATEASTRSNADSALQTSITNEASARAAADLLLAPLASPALTGNPTAPTPSAGDSDTSIATTAFVAAALSYPIHTTIWFDEAISNKTLFFESISTRAYALNIYQDPNANGDWIETTFYLSAGTYTFGVLGVAEDDAGILDWSVDGVPIITGQDWYNAAPTGNTRKQTSGIVISTSGIHTLRATVNGKNASSVGFYIVLTKAWFR